MSTGSYSGQGSAGAAHTRTGVVRGVVAWTCAVAVGVALALISRGAEAFLVSPGTNDDDAAALLQWWYRLAWPPALMAFGFGWFAESRWTAFLRGAVVAALVSSLQTVGWYVGTVERLTDVLTAAVLGGAMGWLGHQGRGRTLLSVLAALCLPGVMALEVIRPHGGMHPESFGVWQWSAQPRCFLSFSCCARWSSGLGSGVVRPHLLEAPTPADGTENLRLHNVYAANRDLAIGTHQPAQNRSHLREGNVQ